MLVSAGQRSESILCIHRSPPSWLFLPQPSHPQVVTEGGAELPELWAIGCFPLAVLRVVVRICQCCSFILSHPPLLTVPTSLFSASASVSASSLSMACLKKKNHSQELPSKVFFSKHLDCLFIFIPICYFIYQTCMIQRKPLKANNSGS